MIKSEVHIALIEKVNKIALSSNNDKILQSLNELKSYAYGTSFGKVCKEELLHIKTNKLNINGDKFW